MRYGLMLSLALIVCIPLLSGCGRQQITLSELLAKRARVTSYQSDYKSIFGAGEPTVLVIFKDGQVQKSKESYSNNSFTLRDTVKQCTHVRYPNLPYINALPFVDTVSQESFEPSLNARQYVEQLPKDTVSTKSVTEDGVKYWVIDLIVNLESNKTEVYHLYFDDQYGLLRKVIRTKTTVLELTYTRINRVKESEFEVPSDLPVRQFKKSG